MSLMTRAVTAYALLLTAAIPVAALTIKNTSTEDVKISVHNGSVQSVYTVTAGGAVDVKEDCSTDCAVTGPWGFSRLVPQNATIETDGRSLVTAEAVAKPGLVPQNPVAEQPPVEAPETDKTPAAASAAPPAAAAATAAAAAPAAEPAASPPRKRVAKPRKPSKQQSAKKGPPPGSFMMLMQGPSK